MSTPMSPPPGSGGQPGPPVYAAPAKKIQPGRIWYLVAVLVFVGGAAWLTAGLLSLASQIDSFPRAPIPQGGQVSLDHSGGYVVYYEGPGAQSGHIPSFQVRVIPASPGAAVRSLVPYTTSVTYGFGSHQGRAVLTLQVDKPGRFTVETPGQPSLPAGSDLAFGDSVVGGIVGIAVPSALLMLVGFAGFIAILVIRLVQVSRARSAARMAAGGPPPGWPPAGGPPPGGPPPAGPAPGWSPPAGPPPGPPAGPPPAPPAGPPPG